MYDSGYSKFCFLAHHGLETMVKRSENYKLRHDNEEQEDERKNSAGFKRIIKVY